MVLRCDKTGKIFFSSKEAEVHSEETGYQAFSQVALEEKFWVCEETGKKCFTQTEMDLHKRRVPEAVSLHEACVANSWPTSAHTSPSVCFPEAVRSARAAASRSDMSSVL